MKGTGTGDPYYSLPKTPPDVSNAGLQGVIDDLFRVQSNCWAINNWTRVTATNMFVKMDNTITSMKNKASIAEQKRISLIFLNEFQNSINQLSACPPNTWVITAAGTKVSTSDFFKAMTYAFQNKQKLA
jgi:hypothetical protein